MDRRGANENWLPLDMDCKAPTWERVNTAILLDIRDELRKLNSIANCHNTLAIPGFLRKIAKNTTKRKYARRAK